MQIPWLSVTDADCAHGAHCQLFELAANPRTACWLMVDRARWLLEDRGAPAGWRIEVAVGGAVAHAYVVLGALGDEA